MMSGKKQAKLTVKRKLEIIDELSQSQPPSKISLGRKYGVTEGAIRYIWSNKEKIRGDAVSLSDKLQNTVRRSTPAQYADIEEILFNWIKVIRSANLPISPTLIISKAKRIAEELSHTEFKASWCWFEKFKKRKGLQQMVLCGEGSEVDKNDPKTLAELELLYKEISKYHPENIYNMDETGLFFRVLPKYTVLLPEEDIKTTRGRKKAKERVSLVVCTNAVGTHKIPLCMIGKPKTPACIRGRKWPLVYMNQKRAWMDRGIFSRWLAEVFIPEIKKKTDQPVLLLMDNAPGHFLTAERADVKTLFLPANVTS